MYNKCLLIIALLVAASIRTPNPEPFADRLRTGLSVTGHITYLDHKWSLKAMVVRLEEVSALGARGNAALLAYLDSKQNDTNYVWVLLDLQGYDYDAGADGLVTGQEVVVYIAGDYVDERGIDYERCSNEAGDYCTILSLVEGAYPRSMDLYNLPISPGNELIHHGTSSPNWWNGMLVWRIAVP